MKSHPDEENSNSLPCAPAYFELTTAYYTTPCLLAQWELQDAITDITQCLLSGADQHLHLSRFPKAPKSRG